VIKKRRFLSRAAGAARLYHVLIISQHNCDRFAIEQKEHSVSYQLLALDIDGTIVANDLAILPEVAAAVAAAQARGIRVTLATGRMYGSTLPYAERLGIHDPLICYQGGMIRDPLTHEIYEHTAMPGELAAEAIELLSQAGIFVIAYVDERMCVSHRTPELENYLRWHPEGIELVIAPELAAHSAANPPTKLLFTAPAEVVEREMLRLAAHFGDQLAVIRSHAIFGELTAPGISKGSALKSLAARLGIPREQVVAIGDHENDLPMIAWAGLGLAMGNAIPVVRETADAVIPSVEEAGVAWAIERYLLADQRPTTNDQGG
jgi:Cof subfamily protein (haloacid dehalogenase superfamily)